MKAEVRTALIIAAPVLAVAGFAMGMRYGASNAEIYVDVSRSRPVEAGRPIYLQFASMLRESGVDERSPGQALHIEVVSKRGTFARDVVTNEDALAILEVPWERADETWQVRIRGAAPGSDQTDQQLVPAQFEAPLPSAEPLAAVRAAKREGELAPELLVPGGGLPVGFAGDVILRTELPPAGAAADLLHALPVFEFEPGLEGAGPLLPCPSAGIFVTRMRPTFAVAGLRITRASAAARGEWYGAVPTMSGVGSMDLGVAREIPEGKPFEVEVAVPSPKRVLYMEIANARGQWWLTELRGLQDRLKVTVPALPAGDYVAVLSNHFSARDPANTRFQPFHVGAGGACERAAAAVGPTLEAGLAPQLILPGVALANSHHRARRLRGFALGFTSLVTGLAALAVLVIDALRQSSRQLAQLSAEAELQDQAIGKSGTSTAVVSLVLAFLAFSVLALVAAAKGL